MLPSPFLFVLSTVDGTYFTLTMKGNSFMTSKHKFNAYLDAQGIEEPDYHEHVLAMQELEQAHETALRNAGAVYALIDFQNYLYHRTSEDSIFVEIDRRITELVAKGGIA